VACLGGNETSIITRLRESVYNVFRETGFYQQLLGNLRFAYTVDLGCGYGLMGRYLRSHTRYLVGVDVDKESLERARKKKLYDELVQTDIRNYDLPIGSDSVFLVEVIEHLPRRDGEAILRRLKWVPFVCIVTPARFYDCSLLAKFAGNKAQKHQSLWTRADFERLGYTVYVRKYSGLRRFLGFFFDCELIAIKRESNVSVF